MPVTIRLRRVGRNKQSNFRVVVTEKTAPRDGAYLETIGFYNPRSRPAELRLDLGKLDEWMAKGAELSETVASLARKARRGGDQAVKMVPVGGEQRARMEATAAAEAASEQRTESAVATESEVATESAPADAAEAPAAPNGASAEEQ